MEGKEIYTPVYEFDAGVVGMTETSPYDELSRYEEFAVVSLNGQSYLSRCAVEAGMNPEQHPEKWLLLAARGESLYQANVRTGRFVGTEEEFLQQYADTLQLAADKAALADAAATNANTAANKANEAATGAVSAKDLADTAASNADKATAAADAATKDTIAAKGLAEEATTNANAAKDAAEKAARETLSAKALTEEATRNATTATTTITTTNKNVTEAEGLRVTAENERAKAEDSRATAESARAKAEGSRASAESARAKTEGVRVSQEDGRVKAEALRVTAENGRVTAETERVKAEAARVSEFGTLKAASEKATADAVTAAATVDGRVTHLESKVTELEGYHGNDYCVGKWADAQQAPEAIEVKGNKAFALNWYPWLVDMTDNKGPKVTKSYSLKKNNWFRKGISGEFSPAVCITAADYSLCDAELYLDAAHTQKYCEAGTFDAEAFYNEYGVSQPLYGVDGVEIAHIRRPWETTNKDLSIGIGRKEKIYLCDHQEGSDGNLLNGVFKSQSNYDGAQFGQFALEPTILSATPVCTVGGKTRSFFYLMKGEGNCQSGMGKNNITDMFRAQNITYPRTNDMHQINDMKWARANNAEPTSPVPFAEGGAHAINTFISCMEIGYGTKFLHAANMFSSGISSNDSCTDEPSWLSHGGVRYKKQGESIWKYGAWNASTDIYYDGAGKRTNLSETLNDYFPKAGVNEAQIALSYAAELGIKPGARFTLYGATYWYEDVEGATPLLQGEMNARLYKIVLGTVNGFNADGTPQVFDVEACLRIGIIQGMKLSGDHWAYWGGGHAQVGINDKGGNGTGFPVKLFLQPDQKKWIYNTESSRNINSPFREESEYIHLGDTVNTGDNYIIQRVPYAGYGKKNGGDIGHGECYYSYNYNWWNGSKDTRTLIAFRLFGYADTFCSQRSLFAASSVTFTYRHSGGSAQVLNGSPECNALQAQ